MCLLYDRRMIISQKTTGDMTPVSYGRGFFQFSLVCKITKTSVEESEGGQGKGSVLQCEVFPYFLLTFAESSLHKELKTERLETIPPSFLTNSNNILVTSGYNRRIVHCCKIISFI